MEMKSMDILSIQDRAKKRKLAGYSVINGSAGMLYRDGKELCTYPLVNQSLAEKTVKYLGYPNPIGSSQYKEAVLEWIFKEDAKRIQEKYSIPFSCTLGGTGAIAMAMYEEHINDGFLALSDLNWPNYYNMAEIHELPVVQYKRFENGRFSFENVRKAFEEGLKKKKHGLFILNDPCQNPTGYCFSEEEYDKLFNLMEEYKGRVTLILDIAYADYAPMGFLFLDILKKRDFTFPLYVAFSASKCFGLYGLRLGAIFGLLDKKDDEKVLKDKFYSLARGTYSCPNNGAMGPVTELLLDEKKREELRKDIEAERIRLAKIGKRMATMLDEIHVDHFPYGGGFYVTLSKENSKDFCLRLEEEDIYLVPIQNKYIRVAVSGLNLEEIERIKEVFIKLQ